MYSYKGDVTVNGKIYKDGTEALKRLEDYGCVHFKTTVILGISQPRYDKKRIEEQRQKDNELIEFNGQKKTKYEWTQAQRRIERETRKQYATENIAKSAGNNTLARDCREKADIYRQKYDELCDTVGLEPRYNRMAVYNSRKDVDIDGKSGIINTKILSDYKVANPMDSQKYNAMKIGLEKNGIKVIQAKDDDLRYLKSIGGEASYGHGYIMHIGEIPSASAMFEEIIHSTQAKIYGEFNDYNALELYSREICANRMLLKYSKAYGFDELDIKDISKNLEIWERKYLDMAGVEYDENKYSRYI